MMSLDVGDVEDLRAFVAIVDSNGLTAAARVLRMPKSTISRKLAALEGRLGFRLLERSSRSVRVTEAGTSVYHYAQRIIDEIELLSNALKPGEAQGLLRVTCSFSLAASLLRPLLASFLDQYPSIDIELEASSNLSDLVRSDFDVALRAGALTGGSMIARRLGQVDVGLFASPEWLRRNDAEPATLNVQTGNRLGLLRSGTKFRSERSASKPSDVRRPRLSLNDPFLIKGQVLEGFGIAWLPTYLCRAEIKVGSLVRCRPDETLHGAEVFALHPGRREMPPKSRVFIDHLIDGLDLS